MNDWARAAVSLHRQQRMLIGRSIEGLDDAALCRVPSGRRNNILWNLGHIVVSQQQLVYGLSGREMYVSEALLGAFRQGTSPDEWVTTPDIPRVISLLKELPDRFESDLDAGGFTSYQGYTTSTGLELRTLEDGVTFNHFHEGVHTGVVMGLRKMVEAD